MRRISSRPGRLPSHRHGFYSGSFNLDENHSLDDHVLGEFVDEEALARVNALRLARLLKDFHQMDVHDAILGFKALANLIGSIHSLGRVRHQLYQNQTTVEQALAELDALDVDEDTGV